MKLRLLKKYKRRIICMIYLRLKQFENIFNCTFSIQKQKFEGKITEEEAEIKLNEIQKELDEMVGGMYM
ncbi:MAG: hypothetical protein ABIN39_07435 [candidate division WOR-3 bacterium]